jgi:hypothetical protein
VLEIEAGIIITPREHQEMRSDDMIWCGIRGEKGRCMARRGEGAIKLSLLSISAIREIDNRKFPLFFFSHSWPMILPSSTASDIVQPARLVTVPMLLP